jgi:6,7-dimethyl-8-ribityllumazine synthase
LDRQSDFLVSKCGVANYIMKQALSSKELPKISGARIAILQSKWHRQYTDNMISHCRALLQEAGCGEIEVHILPGSLELPLAAQTLAERDTPPDAIIAFGIIVKGDTYHFELISNECMRGFGQVMLEKKIPIIVEVIPVLNIADAEARSRDDEFNKGIEAASAAAEVIAWRRSLIGG